MFEFSVSMLVSGWWHTDGDVALETDVNFYICSAFGFSGLGCGRMGSHSVSALRSQVRSRGACWTSNRSF